MALNQTVKFSYWWDVRNLWTHFLIVKVVQGMVALNGHFDDEHRYNFKARAASSMASRGSLGGGIFRSVGSTPQISVA